MLRNGSGWGENGHTFPGFCRKFSLGRLWRMISLWDDSGRGQGGETMIRFQGAHVVQALILTCVRWSLASPLRYRQREELRQERGVSVDHATIHRGVLP
jgi:hypothetical protein